MPLIRPTLLCALVASSVATVALALQITGKDVALLATFVHFESPHVHPLDLSPDAHLACEAKLSVSMDMLALRSR